jgi:hypothetical protein
MGRDPALALALDEGLDRPLGGADPGSSSRRSPASFRTSYHARMTCPVAIVMGRLGA